MAKVTLSAEFTVFNAPSHTYVPSVYRAALGAGFGCEIFTVRNGYIRSRYCIILTGEEREVRQFLARM